MNYTVKALAHALGADYEVRTEVDGFWADIYSRNALIGRLDFGDSTIETWIYVKWRSAPAEWIPFHVELGGEELLSGLRQRWKAYGFTLAEGISSYHKPTDRPGIMLPAVEVRAMIHVPDIKSAVIAIKFVAIEQRDVWVPV